MDTKIICNKTQVERYLLNRMTEEEEILFQKHLINCETCRNYLSKIRRLAAIVGQDGLYINTKIHNNKSVHAPYLKYWISTAACILLVTGISTLWYKKQQNENTLYPTSIEHKIRSTNDKVEVKLFYPDKDTIRLYEEESLLFKWKPQCSFHLKIIYKDKLILDEKGYGQNYSVPIKLLTSDSELIWNMTIDSLVYSGIILNETNK